MAQPRTHWITQQQQYCTNKRVHEATGSKGRLDRGQESCSLPFFRDFHSVVQHFVTFQFAAYSKPSNDPFIRLHLFISTLLLHVCG